MFEGIISDPIKIWNDVWRNFSEFLHVQENARSHSTPQTLASSWNPPPHGFIKINVDVSFDQRSKTASLAAIARGSDGSFITGANALNFAGSPLVAEALAVRLGSMLANTQQWRNTILESDNQTMIKCLKGYCKPLWEYVVVHDDISLLIT
ncbi:uncharacterized protein LOC108455304 [Gossypium arboreum]|uniref:RNase H type-1 domain-containing protein n=1 Tax=Gossypium hirsutum TaxID=3635 RepID=A0A1U8PVZ8_GOSHI|nr:uncharacterized protein LOC107963284 [Gossypium hirsutum]XP_017609373.1 uncharacterized protein LOC108455304 [Gossypium arboreum]